jgi:hypothetical protein
MSWLSNKLKKSSLGTFWDTHIGRKGFFGEGLEMLGLGESGTTADRRRSAGRKLGGYMQGVKDREQPIRDHYGALDTLYKKDNANQISQLDFGARTQNEAIGTQKNNQYSMMNLVSHGGIEESANQATQASNFQYGVKRSAMDTRLALNTTRNKRAETTELQGLSDLVYQLNDQYNNMMG